jgi:BirA family biotin operon repressor/biotin-[acetyl-CoA-carboxylase] ligase
VRGGQFAATLATRVVGREIRHVTQTGSTNDDLKLIARAGAAEGFVLGADEQTEGRGRRGRAWSAPPGSSLLCSTLLRPAWLPPTDAFYLTILAAVACAEAIEAVADLQVELKWPNDLLFDDRKLGGILVETEIANSVLSWAIVGIGLNVNWDTSSHPELRTTATTLAAAAGRPVSRVALLASLLRHLDDRYLRLRAGQRQQLFENWRGRLATLGKPVRAEIAAGAIEGYAEGVTPQGALIIRDGAGKRHELTAGDVTVRNQPETLWRDPSPRHQAQT